MNLDSKLKTKSIPPFLEMSQILINKLKTLTEKDIAQLMKISPELSKLNLERYLDWKLPFTPINSYAAVDLFSGPAYLGLTFKELSKTDQTYGHKNLFILSGLYGLIKPLDAIAPYRLEMGTRFSPDNQSKNLYQYWGETIYQYFSKIIAKEKNAILVNLASNEYSKVMQLTKIEAQIITPIFKDQSKSGEYKIIMAYAKRARGLMARFIIQNRIQEIHDLQSFDLEGYKYSKTESKPDQPVFLRKASKNKPS